MNKLNSKFFFIAGIVTVALPVLACLISIVIDLFTVQSVSLLNDDNIVLFATVAMIMSFIGSIFIGVGISLSFMELDKVKHD